MGGDTKLTNGPFAWHVTCTPPYSRVSKLFWGEPEEVIMVVLHLDGQRPCRCGLHHTKKDEACPCSETSVELLCTMNSVRPVEQVSEMTQGLSIALRIYKKEIIWNRASTTIGYARTNLMACWETT